MTIEWYDIFSFFQNVIFIGLCIFLFIAAYLYVNQNSMIYMPEVVGLCTKDIQSNPEFYRAPSEVGMHYKEVKINTQDNIKLYGWFIYHEEDELRSQDRALIIYYHENAGNLGFRIPFSKYLYENLEANILVVGYRGYGYSEGEPSENGIMLDGEAIAQFAFDKTTDIARYINPDNIFIFGRSLGGAVAVYVMTKLNFSIRGLILENTFTSIDDIITKTLPTLRWFKSLILANHWPTKDRIMKIIQPIMFFISEKDELVPRYHMEKLFDTADMAKFKQKYVIESGTHNESWQFAYTAYIKELELFMEKCGYRRNDMLLYGGQKSINENRERDITIECEPLLVKKID